ncbi:MAG: DUF981 domain-containing protein [Candidatus Marsarchaeota archaeon]|nr:DUF981 domain-containing protein [Candidatus Marsarchaeota archaeon]
MTFVDALAFQLFSLAFVATLLFYAGVSDYRTYLKRGFREAYLLLRSQAVLFGVMGIVVLIIGLWGEMTWPISVLSNGSNVMGAYNILFYDPYLMLGMVLVSFAVCVMMRLNTRYAGLLALMTGALSIYYGINAYMLGLTEEPLFTLILYIGLGGTAIFTFPVTIFVDKIIIEPMHGNKTDKNVKRFITWPWKLAHLGFLLFLLFSAASALLALAIGGGALAPHLSNPP